MAATAARRLLTSGCTNLLRARQVNRPMIVRNQSIWTVFKKVREPPNGFLFNEKPRKPGEKRQWEDWEAIWYSWWAFIFVSCGFLFYFKPDSSIDTWARQQALKELAEEEGSKNSTE